MVAECELEQIVLVMLHPQYCSDFFSVDLALMQLVFAESQDHTEMQIKLTEMSIRDQTNHPYTNFTNDPKEVGAQSTVGNKSPYSRRVISMAPEERQKPKNPDDKFTMVFNFRGYSLLGNCPLKKEGTSGMIDLDIKAINVDYDQEFILRV
jgi:hypothetical protein